MSAKRFDMEVSMNKLLFWLILLITILTGCSAAEKKDNKVTGEIFAMDTYMTVTCYGGKAEQACEAATAEIRRLDDLLSVGKAESEVSRINREGKATLSSDTKTLMETSLSVWERTGGAFDVTVYPLMQLWGFTTGNYAVPDREELNKVLEHVGCDQLTYDSASGQLSLSEGQGLDFGGIAKGYTSDRLAEIFESYELEGAVVSLGGNVQVYGHKPDGTAWKCGIQDPFAPAGSGAVMGALEPDQAAVITSGAYERFFTDEEGVAYHHIIDPDTGYPAVSDLVSVTIVSRNGIEADALSTACYIMGLEKASGYWKKSDREFDMILVSEEGTVYITEPLEDSFTTDYPIQIITGD